MEDKNRVLFWDILKGIGIISIVMGHSQNNGLFIRTLYYYHLAVFFFVSGYFYREERYGDQPFLFFGKRLGSMWPPYAAYALFFVVFHNLFVKLYLFAAPLYTTKDFLTAGVNSLFLNCGEMPSGALWFVPVMLMAGAVFSAVVWFCRTYLPGSLKLWGTAAGCALAGSLGLLMNWKGMMLSYHVQTSLLVVPLYYVGYLLRTLKIDVTRYVRWYGAVACGAFFYYCLVWGNYSVELSMNAVPPGVMFYLISLAGIYLCCCAGVWIGAVRPLGRLIAAVGRYSFDIMAFHFVMFKLVDGIYGRLVQAPLETLSTFPHSFNSLHLVYLFFGILGPVLAGMAGRKLFHLMSVSLKRFSLMLFPNG